jgi:hypothetical protein
VVGIVLNIARIGTEGLPPSPGDCARFLGPGPGRLDLAPPEAELKIAAPRLDGHQHAPSRIEPAHSECEWKHGERTFLPNGDATGDNRPLDVKRTGPPRRPLLTEGGLLMEEIGSKGALEPSIRSRDRVQGRRGRNIR